MRAPKERPIRIVASGFHQTSSGKTWTCIKATTMPTKPRTAPTKRPPGPAPTPIRRVSKPAQAANRWKTFTRPKRAGGGASAGVWRGAVGSTDPTSPPAKLRGRRGGGGGGGGPGGGLGGGFVFPPNTPPPGGKGGPRGGGGGSTRRPLDRYR